MSLFNLNESDIKCFLSIPLGSDDEFDLDSSDDDENFVETRSEQVHNYSYLNQKHVTK